MVRRSKKREQDLCKCEKPLHKVGKVFRKMTHFESGMRYRPSLNKAKHTGASKAYSIAIIALADDGYDDAAAHLAAVSEDKITKVMEDDSA